jgi:hypothetical protein
MLIFRGFPGTVVGGAGRYVGATAPRTAPLDRDRPPAISRKGGVVAGYRYAHVSKPTPFRR